MRLLERFECRNCYRLICECEPFWPELLWIVPSLTLIYLLLVRPQ